MRPLRIIVALLLTALWLPATLHCGLATAGLIAQADSCCHEETGMPAHADCTADNCGLVEGGDYQVTGNLVKVAAPVWQDCVLCLIEIAPAFVQVPEIVVAEEVESPPEVKRTWHIVSRAAPLPGAPSLIAA